MHIKFWRQSIATSVVFTVAALLVVLGATVAYAALVDRSVAAAAGAVVDGWRSSDGWGAYSFDTGSSRPVSSGGQLAWCLDHGHAPPSDLVAWDVTAPTSGIPRTTANGGGSISTTQLAQVGYVVAKWEATLSAPYSTAELETSAAMMLAVHDLSGTNWPIASSGPLNVNTLTTADFSAGWSGYDTSRILALARAMVAEAEAQAAVGAPTLDEGWTDPITSVGDSFAWRVRLTNGDGGGMASWPITVTPSVLPAGNVAFSSPLSGVTDANGYFTVTGTVTDGVRLTLAAAVTGVPSGVVQLATDPRFDVDDDLKSQRMVMASTVNLTVQSATAIAEPLPEITTQVSEQLVSIGAQITDTATVTDAAPGGTITFEMFGPYTTAPGATDCAADDRVGSSTVSVPAVDGDYTSPPFTATAAGWYTWRATFARDDGETATHPCGETTETFEVRPDPSITTEVSAQLVSIGAQVTDTATITNAAPGGTVTFNLYGPFPTEPGDDDCESAAPVSTGRAVEAAHAVSTVSVVVTADGDYTSPPITVTAAGFYTWQATYMRDDGRTATHDCGLVAESFEVRPDPSITTEVSAQLVSIGAQVTDTATITNAAPGGTVTFNLYGPYGFEPAGDHCQPGELVGSVSVVVTADGEVVSPPITVTAAGLYTWRATFARDDGRTATHDCGEASETFEVRPDPSITTEASAQLVSIGAQVTDTATITNAAPGGTVTFNLYGPYGVAPGADACEAADLVGTVSVVVTADGEIVSPSITVTAAGFYTWQATYARDDGRTATHDCGEASESFEVRADPSITTEASADEVMSGSEVTDAATIVNAAPGGTVTFNLYGPYAVDPGGDACQNTDLVGAVSVVVTADGEVVSPSITVTAAGLYTWQATYERDDGRTATHDCGLVAETFVVLAPGMSIDKIGSLEEAEPGDEVVYRLSVVNTGDVPLTGVLVVDVLPEGIDASSLRLVAGASYATVDGRVLLWSIPEIPVGETVFLSYTAEISETFTGVVENTIRVTTATPDVPPLTATWKIVVRAAVPSSEIRVISALPMTGLEMDSAVVATVGMLAVFAGGTVLVMERKLRRRRRDTRRFIDRASSGSDRKDGC